MAEVIEKSIPILKRHFPEYTYRLKYEQDPECDELSLVRIHVNSDRSKFDEDFETTRDVNRAIRHLDVEDDDEKFYLAADLWRL